MRCLYLTDIKILGRSIQNSPANVFWDEWGQCEDSKNYEDNVSMEGVGVKSER